MLCYAPAGGACARARILLLRSFCYATTQRLLPEHLFQAALSCMRSFGGPCLPRTPFAPSHVIRGMLNDGGRR